jgi:hypothetical protein
MPGTVTSWQHSPVLCGSNWKGWMLEIGGKEDEETVLISENKWAI